MSGLHNQGQYMPPMEDGTGATSNNINDNPPGRTGTDAVTATMPGTDVTKETPGENTGGTSEAPGLTNGETGGAGTETPGGGTGNGTGTPPAPPAEKKYNIETSVPDQFKGSTNAALISYLEQKIAENEATKEDEQKMRRRHRTEGIISGISDAVRSVANLVATSQYAPNMFNPAESMSEKARERFEKEKAERQAKDDSYFNYALNLAKLKGEDHDRALNIWMTDNNLQRQERDYDNARSDYNESIAFRNKQYEDSRADRAEDMKHWQMEFDEGVRQYNESLKAGKAAARSAGGGRSRGGGWGGYKSSKDKDPDKGLVDFQGIGVPVEVLNDDEFLAQHWQRFIKDYESIYKPGGGWSKTMLDRMRKCRTKEDRHKFLQYVYNDYSNDPNKNAAKLASVILGTNRLPRK